MQINEYDPVLVPCSSPPPLPHAMHRPETSLLSVWRRVLALNKCESFINFKWNSSIRFALMRIFKDSWILIVPWMMKDNVQWSSSNEKFFIDIFAQVVFLARICVLSIWLPVAPIITPFELENVIFVCCNCLFAIILFFRLLNIFVHSPKSIYHYFMRKIHCRCHIRPASHKCSRTFTPFDTMRSNRSIQSISFHAFSLLPMPVAIASVSARSFFYLHVSFAFFISWLLYPWFFCSAFREFIFEILFYIIAFCLAFFQSLQHTPSPTLKRLPHVLVLLLVDLWFVFVFFFPVCCSLNSVIPSQSSSVARYYFSIRCDTLRYINSIEIQFIRRIRN